MLTKLWQACTDTVWLHLQDTYIMDPSRKRAFYQFAGEMEQFLEGKHRKAYTRLLKVVIKSKI